MCLQRPPWIVTETPEEPPYDGEPPDWTYQSHRDDLERWEREENRGVEVLEPSLLN